MPNLQVPGSLCLLLHPDYQGPDSPIHIKDAIIGISRKMVIEVIKQKIPPARLPGIHDPGISRNVSFPASIMNVIEDHAIEANLIEPDAISAYLYAAIARGDALAYRPVVADGLAPYREAANPDWKRRADQTLLFDCINETIEKRQVGLIEGATGIGKTLAMVAAAAKALDMGGRAVICAPTIQVLRDFIQAHAAIEKGMPEMPAKRVVLGRPEYVSVELLQSVLNDGPVAIDPTAIRDWLRQGGPAVGRDEALERNYLVSSLLSICPAFPVAAVRLTDRTSLEDPGAKSYRQQFERDNEQSSVREIIYCTHAMMAIDLRRYLHNYANSRDSEEDRGLINKIIKELQVERSNIQELDESADTKQINKRIADVLIERDKAIAAFSDEFDFGHLPPWQYLIIDEAHLFESNLAGVLATKISIKELAINIEKAVEGGFLPKRVSSTIAKVYGTLRRLGGNGDIDLNNVADPREATRQSVTQSRIALAEVAEAICSSRHKRDEPVLITALRHAARDIKQALDIANKSARLHSCTLQFSPVREFPQLTFGRRSLAQELRVLWGRATAAACVSATLYLRKTAKYSADFMVNILSIPKDRVREFQPIRPSWSLTPVLGVWTPEAKLVEGRYWLQPPSRSDRNENGDSLSNAEAASVVERWQTQVADAIANIHKDAVGGTLVLMTSYDSVRHVAHQLADRVGALVQANTSTTLDQQRRLFVDYAKSGKRPVWLALGGAWTGLDVNGDHYGILAKDDNLITDLVIPRIPFGINSSTTHQHRMDILSAVPWDLLDATMRFKQGIGRLVRREGLPKNRRIFVLDGRLNDPKFSSYLLPVRQVMELYPANRVAFG